MRQLPYKAIIVDFDRTLLHTDKSISAYTQQVLREWRKAGAFLFAATARPERAITEFCRILDIRTVTTLNGARTITPGGVFDFPVSAVSAESVLDRLCSVSGTVISAEAESGIYANTDIPDWSPKVTDNIRGLPRQEKIYKILASHPLIPADEICPDLPEDTYSTVADRKLLQVMSRNATKWNGVKQMLEAYKIAPEQAIYFGDDNDDMEPIRRCGCGVAVSNGLEHVRDAADYVAGSNDEDGVAVFLDRLIRES